MSNRTTARGVILLLFLGLLAGSAVARPAKPPAQIVFPVIGPVTYEDDFGDPRGQGPHEGIDIMAPKRSVAVAAEGGKVSFWATSWAAGCMLYLHGDSGTTYLYIHLNNDLADGNDNRGKCVAGTAYANGLADGDRVEAGQPIGFVGDSGDANGVGSHLHFEVHPGGGGAVDPYPYLREAQQVVSSATPRATVSLVITGRLVSALSDRLELKADVIRALPSRLRLDKPGRTISVNVPSSATVEARSTSLRIGGLSASLANARTGQRVVVWTEPGPVTLQALAGADGGLTAARVVLVA